MAKVGQLPFSAFDDSKEIRAGQQYPASDVIAFVVSSEPFTYCAVIRRAEHLCASASRRGDSIAVRSPQSR